MNFSLGSVSPSLDRFVSSTNKQMCFYVKTTKTSPGNPGTLPSSLGPPEQRALSTDQWGHDPKEPSGHFVAPCADMEKLVLGRH